MATEPEATSSPLFTEVLKYSPKKRSRVVCGKLKFTSSPTKVRYVIVPDDFIMSDDCRVDLIFAALGLNPPHLVLELPSVREPPNEWNFLVHNKLWRWDANTRPSEAQMAHLRGSLVRALSRTFKHTADACKEAGAYFQVNERYCHSARLLKEVAPPGSVLFSTGLWGQPKYGYAKDFFAKLKESGTEVTPVVGQSPESASDDNLENLVVFDDRELIEQRPSSLKELDPTNLHDNEFCKYLGSLGGQDKSQMMNTNITHAVYFESNEGVERFEQLVTQNYPFGFLCVNGRSGAVQHAIRCLEQNLPLFIFRHSGGAADMLSMMVDHLYDAKQGRKPATELPFANLTDSNENEVVFDHCTGPLLPLGLQSKNGLRLNEVAEVFPFESYKPESTLVIDPFSFTAEELQDKITATMGTIYEGVLEIGSASADQKRLRYAWGMYRLLKYNSIFQRTLASVLQCLIILTTFFTTLITVVYVHLQNKDDPPSKTTLDSLKYVNIILPALVTFFLGLYSKLSPTEKWAALTIGASRVESQIYMYRTKAGPYDPRLAKRNNAVNATAARSMQSDGAATSSEQGGGSGGRQLVLEPRAAFSAALDAIWADIALSDMQKGSLRTPFADSFFPVSKLRKSQKLVESSRYAGVIFASMRQLRSPSPQQQQQQQSFRQLDAEVEAVVTSQGPSTVAEAGNNTTTAQTDDGFSDLSADEYIRFRLLPQLLGFSSLAPTLDRTVTWVDLFVLLIAGVCTVLAAVDENEWINVLLGFSTALLSWMSFRQIPTRLMNVNGVLAQLHQLMVWWNGLTVIQRRVPANRNYLVCTTEEVIQAKHAAYVSAMKTAGKPKDGEEEDSKAG